MTGQRFSDETLMAFADGELAPDEQKSVEQAMETDEALAERVALFLDSRGTSQNALKPLLNEPVPDDLTARVTAMQDGGANVTAFPQRQSPPTERRWALPLAASIALVAGGLGGYFTGISSTDQQQDLALDLVTQPAIITALNTVTSGEEKDLGSVGRFKVIASYSDASDTFCREFEVDRVDRSTIVAVACRPEQTWEYRFTVVAGQSNSGYAPASSLEALDAYLDAVGASEPMSTEAEDAALKSIN
ncbi:MAG: anti-sigma factor [Hyphomicrobiales bacterium]|nr:anti-sigma factor [Hyphomicrobiales bacterium]MCP4998520.1 anti-sigma factor [Hyphomicrobiales bacterium]